MALVAVQLLGPSLLLGVFNAGDAGLVLLGRRLRGRGGSHPFGLQNLTLHVGLLAKTFHSRLSYPGADSVVTAR